MLVFDQCSHGGGIYTVSARSKEKTIVVHYMISIPTVKETDLVFIVSSKSTENTNVVYITSDPTV